MILAIDDEAERYEHLDDLLRQRGGLRVQVACCSACVSARLPEARAVLLDHDLYGGTCPGCGSERIPPDTRDYVQWLRCPVVVTSASQTGNRLWLAEAARRALAPLRLADKVAMLSAMEPDPELRWLGQLYAWGVL